MFNGITPGWFPSLPISVEREARIRSAQFGDGYQQRIVDGLNAITTRWNLTFDNRPRDILTAIDEYLQDQIGEAFPFLHPIDGVTYNVYCDTWSTEWHFRKWEGNVLRHDYGTLTATFQRAYGVTI